MGWPGPTTRRQFLVWSLWVNQQWDTPTRSDWYLMQLSADVLRAAGAKKVTTNDRRIKFSTGIEKPKKPPHPSFILTKERIQEMHKQRTVASLTFGPTTSTNPLQQLADFKTKQQKGGA